MVSLFQEKFLQRMTQRAHLEQEHSQQQRLPPHARSGAAHVPIPYAGDDESLLMAVSGNTPSLRCLRVSSRLLRAAPSAIASAHHTTTPAHAEGLVTPLSNALAANTTLRSLEVTREGYQALQAMAVEAAKNTLAPQSTSTTTATRTMTTCDLSNGADAAAVRFAAWTNLMLACYGLPLRSLQLSDLDLAPNEVEQALRLVAHLAGTDSACGRARQPPQSTTSRLAARGTVAASTAAPSSSSASASSRVASGTLEFLDLSRNQLTPTAASLLHDILYHSNCSLRRVCLNECGLTDAGAARLFCQVDHVADAASATTAAATAPTEGISTRLAPRLEELELRWNGFTPACETEVQLAYVAARVLSPPPRTTSIDANASNAGGDHPNHHKHAGHASKVHVTAAAHSRTRPLVMRVEGNHFSAPAHTLLGAPESSDQNRRRASREAGAAAAAVAARRARVVGAGPPNGPSSGRTGTSIPRGTPNERVSPFDNGLPSTSKLTGAAVSVDSSFSSTGGGGGGAAAAGGGGLDDQNAWRHDFVTHSPLRQRITPSSQIVTGHAGGHASHAAGSRGPLPGASMVSGAGGAPTTISTVTSIGAGTYLAPKGAHVVSLYQPSTAPASEHAMHSPRSALSGNGAGYSFAAANTSTASATTAGAAAGGPSFALVHIAQAVDQQFMIKTNKSSGSEKVPASSPSSPAGLPTAVANPRTAEAVASSGGLGLTSDHKLALRRARRRAAAAKAGPRGGDKSAEDGESDGDEEGDAPNAVASLLGVGGRPHPAPRPALERFPALHMAADLLQRRSYWDTYFRNKQQKAARDRTKQGLARSQEAQALRELQESATLQASPAALANQRAVVQLVKALGDDAVGGRCGGPVPERHDRYAHLRAVASLMAKSRDGSD